MFINGAERMSQEVSQEDNARAHGALATHKCFFSNLQISLFHVSSNHKSATASLSNHLEALHLSKVLICRRTIF